MKIRIYQIDALSYPKEEELCTEQIWVKFQ